MFRYLSLSVCDITKFEQSRKYLESDAKRVTFTDREALYRKLGSRKRGVAISRPLIRSTVRLSVESKLDQVWMVRASLAGILNDLKVPSGEVFLIQLAVSEIVSNAIEHGYAGSPGHQVDVAVQITGPEVSVDVTDDAPAFPGNEMLARLQDHESQGEPDDTWPARGHGLQIASRVVDSLRFSRTGDRNCVTLIKHLSVETPVSTHDPDAIGIE